MYTSSFVVAHTSCKGELDLKIGYLEERGKDGEEGDDEIRRMYSVYNLRRSTYNQKKNKTKQKRTNWK